MIEFLFLFFLKIPDTHTNTSVAASKWYLPSQTNFIQKDLERLLLPFVFDSLVRFWTSSWVPEFIFISEVRIHIPSQSLVLKELISNSEHMLSNKNCTYTQMLMCRCSLSTLFRSPNVMVLIWCALYYKNADAFPKESFFTLHTFIKGSIKHNHVLSFLTYSRGQYWHLFVFKYINLLHTVCTWDIN